MKNNEDIKIMVEQWKTCVEMANSVSQRRDTMNNIFVTLNLAIVAAISMNWDKKTMLLLLAGIVVCVIWLLFICNFKLLNAEKFGIINSIEKELPVKPFNEEWEKLKSNKKYRDCTNLERLIPMVFLILYVILAILTIVDYFIAGGYNNALQFIYQSFVELW